MVIFYLFGLLVSLNIGFVLGAWFTSLRNDAFHRYHDQNEPDYSDEEIFMPEAEIVKLSDYRHRKNRPL